MLLSGENHPYAGPGLFGEDPSTKVTQLFVDFSFPADINLFRPRVCVCVGLPRACFSRFFKIPSLRSYHGDNFCFVVGELVWENIVHGQQGVPSPSLLSGAL